MNSSLIFVDVEAHGPCPAMGYMTEFAFVEYGCTSQGPPETITRNGFHAWVIHGSDAPASRFPENGIVEVCPAFDFTIRAEKCMGPIEHVMSSAARWLARTVGEGVRPVMVSDNPAFDFMWICDAFWRTMNTNPFGHSARRIADFAAGLNGDFRKSQGWKALRVTKHTHDPVMDVAGNLEAFDRLLKGER